MKHFLIALQFFTRIPITGRLAAWVGYSPAMLRASSLYFPVVGSVVGAFAALILFLSWHVLPASTLAAILAATLATAASIWLTGGFHEDGLADTADGLGGYVSAEQALHIMKDSRIGSYGSLTLVLMLILKISSVALLIEADWRFACAALLWAHTLSRCVPLLLMACLSHVGDLAHSKSKPLADAISTPRLVAAGMWPLLLSLAIATRWPSGAWLLALSAMLLLSWRMAAWLRQRIGGFTGDTLGASQQLAELLAYLALLCWPQIDQYLQPLAA